MVDLSTKNITDALLFAENSIQFIIDTTWKNKLAHVFNLAPIPAEDLDEEKGVKENSISQLRISTLIRMMKGRSLFPGLNPRVITMLGNKVDNIYYIAVVMNPRSSVCTKNQNPSPQLRSDSDDLINLNLDDINECDETYKNFVF